MPLLSAQGQDFPCSFLKVAAVLVFLLKAESFEPEAKVPPVALKESRGLADRRHQSATSHAGDTTAR